MSVKYEKNTMNSVLSGRGEIEPNLDVVKSRSTKADRKVSRNNHTNN